MLRIHVLLTVLVLSGVMIQIQMTLFVHHVLQSALVATVQQYLNVEAALLATISSSPLVILAIRHA